MDMNLDDVLNEVERILAGEPGPPGDPDLEYRKRCLSPDWAHRMPADIRAAVAVWMGVQTAEGLDSFIQKWNTETFPLILGMWLEERANDLRVQVGLDPFQ